MWSADFLKTAGILIAGTVGAGVFALPALFGESGWGTGLAYVVVTAILVAAVHLLYWRVLDSTRGEHRLLGLVEAFLGKRYALLGFLVIVVGLLFVLLIYLVLSERFLNFLLPGIGALGAYLFWALASAPLFLGIKKVAGGEAAVSVAICVIALILIFAAAEPLALFRGDAVVPSGIALPFGPTLFAFSGWTAIQTMYGFWSARRRPGSARALVTLGTSVVTLVYLIFVMGVFALDGARASGVDLGAWAETLGRGRTLLLALFGLIAIWAAYIPISLEVKNTIYRDLRFSKAASFGATLLVPPLLFFAGFTNFIRIVGLVGGVFAALQYLLLLAVAWRALPLRRFSRFFVIAAACVFTLGGVYEIYHFLSA